MKLTRIQYEVEVDVSKEKAWEILSLYGNVGDYHAGVVSSSSINGSGNIAEMGSDRVCHIVDGNRKITVKEKIIEFKAGEYYKYDVYEWVNFPLTKLMNTFGVKTNSEGKTVIYQIMEYRLKPRILGWFMKGKMKSQARDALIYCKYYMETGESKPDWNMVQEKYKAF